MPIQMTCPACQASLKLAKPGLAGKLIRCPKCTKTVRVPAEEEEDLEEASPPPKKQVAAKKPARAAVAEDEEEEAPARPAKKASAAKKPVNRRDEDEEDDEEEDRPRKKGKKGKQSRDDEAGSGMTRNLIGGGVLLILLVVAGVVFAMRWNDMFPSKSADPAKATGTDKAKKPINPKPGPGKKGGNSEKPPPDTGPRTEVTLTQTSLTVRTAADGAKILDHKIAYRFEDGPRAGAEYWFVILFKGLQYSVRVNEPLNKEGVHAGQSDVSDVRTFSPTVKVWMAKTAPNEGLKVISNVLPEVPLKQAGGGEPAPAGPAVAITDLDLSKEYFANPTAAKDKYLGKVLEVSGVVTRAICDSSEPYVELRAAPNILMLNFSLKHEDAINRLSRNQSVTIRGKLSSISLQGVCLLHSCEITAKGKDLVVSVSAAQLTKDFVDSPEAATKKYNDQPVIVTGTVVAAKSDEMEFTFQLAGFKEKVARPVRVVVKCPCFGSGRSKMTFQSVQVGQELQFKGYASAFSGRDHVELHEGVILKKN